MLNEYERATLHNKLISAKDIEDMESYDVQTGRAVFKDGTVRTVTTVMTRCMGYLAALENFNKGKQSEYNERNWFTENNATAHLEAA